MKTSLIIVSLLFFSASFSQISSIQPACKVTLINKSADTLTLNNSADNSIQANGGQTSLQSACNSLMNLTSPLGGTGYTLQVSSGNQEIVYTIHGKSTLQCTNDDNNNVHCFDFFAGNQLCVPCLSS